MLGGFGRLSVPLSCPGALQANQSPQYVLAHPYLVNPWISDRFGGFPGLTRRIVRRCVTVMTSLCSSNSSAELVPFSVWAEPRTAGGYGTLRLAIQTAESPPSPADSHWISVFSSESCTARGPGGVWKRTAPRPPWSRLAGRAGDRMRMPASSETHCLPLRPPAPSDSAAEASLERNGRRTWPLAARSWKPPF